MLAYAIIAALFHRERTGQGQRVEVPMTDALHAFLLTEHGGAAICGRGAAGYPRILTPLRAPVRTADGWIAVQPHRDDHWVTLMREAGLADLAGDSRLTNRGLWHEPGFGYKTLSRVMPGKTTSEWLEFCSRHGIPAAPVADLGSIIEALPDAEHPSGTYKHIPLPVRFSATPATLRRPAPMPGQHNDEVLAEAGFTDAQIAELRADGVLR